jgi:hypothetical protein
MKIKIRDIIEGWRNHLIPPEELKEAINRVSKERLAICKTCPSNSLNKIPGAILEYCTECSCPLIAKTKCLHCSCPLTPTKWGPVVSEEHSLQVITKIDDDE